VLLQRHFNPQEKDIYRTVNMAETTPPQPNVFIRRATVADSADLSRICLLTADAGTSAEHLHSFGDLPGIMYAVPYVHLPSAGGFVLTDRAKASPTTPEEGPVVGYVLSAFDVRKFEDELEESWFPQWRLKYPNPYPESLEPPEPKPDDLSYFDRIHNPPRAADVNIQYSPAHMHIDIVPEYQRKGYGTKLIGTLIKWLKEEKGLEKVWLHMDPRNTASRIFYEKIGFKDVEGAPEGVMGIEFKEWKYE